MPKIDRDAATRYHRQAYPGRLRARTHGCWKTRLSDNAGLTQFGVGEVELAPGAATGLYHWHENEDEFVYVLAGEVVLVEGEEEHLMRAGDCAGFRAGDSLGHTFENRSDAPARLLEIGTRNPAGERVHYPGYDMAYRRKGGETRFTTRDGRPLARTYEPARLADEAACKPRSTLDIE